MIARAPRTGDVQGFVLILALMMVALTSAGVVSIALHGRAGATMAVSLEEAARARNVAQAAIVRSLFSLASSDDSIRMFRSSERAPIRWRFDRFEVTLSLVRERQKIDLNIDSLIRVEEGVRSLDLAEIIKDKIISNVRTARGRKRIIPGPLAIVSPCDRIVYGRTLANAFTAGAFADVSRADSTSPPHAESHEKKIDSVDVFSVQSTVKMFDGYQIDRGVSFILAIKSPPVDLLSAKWGLESPAFSCD